MSYHRELDEYSDAEIKQEHERRVKCSAAGVCQYCSKPLDTHNCKLAGKS